MNPRVKTLWGAKPHVYLVNVAPGVAEVGSLFPARARFKFKSLKKWHAWSARGRSATQNVHQTAARARFCKGKTLKIAMFAAPSADQVGKMRTRRDCSESSISRKNEAIEAEAD